MQDVLTYIYDTTKVENLSSDDLIYLHPLVAKLEASKDFWKNMIFSSLRKGSIMKIAMYITHNNINRISNGFYGSLHMSGIRAYFVSEKVLFS